MVVCRVCDSNSELHAALQQAQQPSDGNATLFDGTLAKSYAIYNASGLSTALSPTALSAIGFCVNENASSCGPGRYTLSQLTLSLASAGDSVLGIQVRLNYLSQDVSEACSAYNLSMHVFPSAVSVRRISYRKRVCCRSNRLGQCRDVAELCHRRSLDAKPEL